MMRLVCAALPLAAVLIVTTGADKIGYFWHLTDIHWDTGYNTRFHNCVRARAVIRPMYGDYSCDSSYELVSSAVHTMLEIQASDVEFILWTGDSLTRFQHKVDKMAALRNLTQLLSNVFTSHFVFPVLGHDDPVTFPDSDEPYKELADLWKQWLPSEALVTFSKGGYYTIERKRTRLRLVALNTNLYTENQTGMGIPSGTEDPKGQWQWLELVLKKSRQRNETVYLVGHMAPGLNERLYAREFKSTMTPYHNARYISLVRDYSDIITGQFFGHLHSDTFRLVYDDDGRPVSTLFLAPSLTPKRNGGGINNPGVRLYQIEVDTGQVLDYSQYYVDLDKMYREKIPEPDWALLYNLTDYYGFDQPSPEALHALAENFTTKEGRPLFSRYLLANSVFTSSEVTGAHSHYCALTKLDYAEYQDCLATTAAPLAAITTPTPVIPATATAPYQHFHHIELTLLTLIPLALR